MKARVTVAVFVLVALMAVPSDGQRRRLPGESLPRAYRVTLTPDLDEGDNPFTYEGSSSIWVEILRNTTTLTLHADVTISDLSVATPDGTNIGAEFELLDDDSYFLVVSLEREATAGEFLWLNIEYFGEIRDGLDGFYRSSYELNGETRWLGVTQFEEIGARMAMPCYDEPAIKSTWTFTFRPRQRWGVLCNTPQLSATNDPDGRRTVTCQETPPVGAYLLAWVISDFVGVQSPLESNTTVWTSSGTAQQVLYASSVAPLTVRTMERLVRVPYNHGNITKMDHVGVPDFSAGAMENWGLVTYRLQDLLILENVTSESIRERVLTVIQHEVSHQWFGNLVSPNWWSVLWLAEGFATFFETFGSAEIEPTWRLGEVFVVSTLFDPAMVYDEAIDSPPITSEFHDSNIYYKGGSLIRMMQHVVGTEVFYDGLHNYLEQNQLSNATDDILFGAMDAVAPSSSLPEGASVSAVMLPWARQSGFPLLTVTRNYSDGSATITQRRWVLPASDGDQTRWTVPVTYTSASEADFSTTTRYWLTGSSAQLDSVGGATADQWVIFNLQVVGFYRVQYDSDNWALLTQQLLSDLEAIPASNRAQLLEDAMALVLGEQLPLDTLLDLVSYLAAEQDYIAWLEAEAVFDFLATVLDTDEYNTLALSLLDDVTSAVGYEARPEDSHTTRILRGLVAGLACDSGQPACTEAAYTQFQRYMQDPSDPDNWVDPDMKSVVYCEGVRQGGDEAYDFLVQQYNSTSVVSEQTEITRAVACRSSRSAVRRVLDNTAAGAVGAVPWRQLPALLEAALWRSRHRAASAAAVDFLADHPQVLLSRGIDKKSIRKQLTHFTRTVCDQDLLDKVSWLAFSTGDRKLQSAAASRRFGLARCDALRRDASLWFQRWKSQHAAA